MRRRAAAEDALWLPGVLWDGGGAASAPEPADAAERAAALDARESFIVQAPAGSGKTELLIQRYLALLARVEQPESIVAITFTIKAAAEMRSRVLDAFAMAARGVEPDKAHERTTYRLATDALERDRRLGWGLASQSSRMRIQTVDALCAAITRQMPWIARLGAMPAVIEDASALYAEAAERTLDLLEGDDPSLSDAVATLLRQVDNDAGAAERLIADMLARREQWLELVGLAHGQDLNEIRSTIETALQRTVAAGLSEAAELVPDDERSEIVELYRYSPNVVAFDAFPGCGPADLESWRRLADFLVTDKEWRRRVDRRHGFAPRTREKDRMEALLCRLASNEPLREALCAISKLPEPRFSEAQWNVLLAVFMLLPRAAAELGVTFASRGAVDFTEIALRARMALGGPESPTDLALSTGARIEHLLVDEFQDTSESQWRLLASLTSGWEQGDGRTLFLVGDPMQSVYRFRQAEVGLFMKARREGLNELEPLPLTLSVNFRSEPGVVNWVNRVFGETFPAGEDIDSGAVTYTESVAFRGGSDDCVLIHPMFGEDCDPDEAALTAKLIESAQLEDPTGSIAVLVRAKTHVAAIAEQLRQRGIRFRATEIETLGERPAVRDLLSLTRALLHRGDRLSWLAILRAPWCGLSLADLHAIAAPDRKAAICDRLAAPDLALSEDGAHRLQRVWPVLRDALSHAGRAPLRDVVESAWVALGGPQSLERAADLDDAMTYLDLLQQSDRGGGLASFSAFQQSVDKLFAQPDPEAGDSLQIMSIHKAKGLQFDTVILPGLGKPTAKDDQRLLVWVERAGPAGQEFLISPVSPRGAADPICKYIERLEREKTRNEASRLLYVACTRARRRLDLIGHVPVGADGSMGKPAQDTLLGRIWESVRDRYESAWTIRAEAPLNAEEEPRLAPALRRVSVDWAPPALPEPVRVPAEARAAATASEAAPFEGVEEAARAVGTLVHRMMDRIARDGIRLWDAARVLAARSAFGNALGPYGDHAGKVESALVRALSDERGRWILGDRAEGATELELAGEIDGRSYRTTVDRTFVEDGVRWIIDYKTSEPPPGCALSAFLDAEQERYCNQLQVYARLFAKLDGRPVRLALYFPLFSGWRDWAA